MWENIWSKSKGDYYNEIIKIIWLVKRIEIKKIKDKREFELRKCELFAWLTRSEIVGYLMDFLWVFRFFYRFNLII